MGIYLVPSAVLLISAMCSMVESHSPKIQSSVISPISSSIERRYNPTRGKTNYQQPDIISQIFLQPAASTSTDQHFQWWDSSSRPELVQSGWYGFNQFAPRTARNLGSNASNRKARTAFLLGESSQLQPLTNYKRQSRQTNQYNEDFAIHEVLRELQRNLRPLPQRDYGEPRIILLEEPYGLPPGLLVPVSRPQHQNSYQRHASYHQPRKEIRRQASAPTPVTIRVVPLKITSLDIANALKSMSFVPLPFDFLQSDEKSSEGNADSISTNSDDDSDLPPPSSHVATPLDKPLGITYAEAQRTEHYMSKYQPR